MTKVRINKAKGKRWKKGSSGTSNPAKKSFRHQARAGHGVFSPSKSGFSQLTKEAVDKHTRDTSDDPTASVDSDAASDSGHSFTTWASNYTHCTNKSFSKVLRHPDSTSALHKDIVAVLAAVTEVIKTKEGKETDVEYFCALTTALESADDEQTTAAIIYLLSLTVNRVSPAILQSRFSELSQQYTELLGTYSESGSVPLLKSVLFVLSTLLRHQQASVWNDRSTGNIFSLLLHLLDHEKPKVRKAAHHAVCAVVRGSPMMQQSDHPDIHPAAKIAANYCIKQIEQSGGVGTAKETLHALGVLRDVMPVLPSSLMRKAAETILRVMTLANPVVRTTCLRTFHGLFDAVPDEDKLSSQINAQIISALFDFQPSENDAQATQAWLTTLHKAYVNLFRLDEALCLGHVPRLFKVCMECVRAARPDVAPSAANTMIELLAEVIGPACSPEQAASTSPTVQQVLNLIQAGLSYQYYTSWGQVLKVIGAFFQHVAQYSPNNTKKCLVQLCELRDTQNFQFTLELDKAIGKAVQTLGPRRVLAAAPLNISGDNDDTEFRRSWLLPVLRDNIQSAELGYFTSYFLPLAVKLRQRWFTFRTEKRFTEAKTYEVLQSQIWSLLPGFCSSPPDIEKSFTPDLARLLATVIEEYTDVRLVALTSLRRIVAHSLSNEPDRTRVSSYVKNYMPKLFNLYTATAEAAEQNKIKLSWRGAVLETVRSLLAVTSQPMLTNFINHAMKLVLDDSTAQLKRVAVMDILNTLVPHSDDAALVGKVVSTFKPMFVSKDKSIQKKAYRLLEEICMSSRESCRTFVRDNLDDLHELLVTALAASSPSAKAPRLRCLCHILQQLRELNWDFISTLLPEAVLCVRETAAKAREAAYKLLLEVAATCIRWHDGDTHAGVLRLFQLLSAGYGGSSQFVANTALAVTRLTYEYRENLSAQLVNELTKQSCVLLKSSAREVVLAALRLTQLVLSLLPVHLLAQHLPALIDGLVMMREANGQQHRMKTKAIYKKLINKFGFDTIRSMVPENHSKMLTNLKKLAAREKRKREERKKHTAEESDEDELKPAEHAQTFEEMIGGESDLEDETAEKKERGTRAKRSDGTVLMENDDAVDFMDPSASKHVVGKRKAPKERKKDSSFETADGGFKRGGDGRLIITEMEEEEEAPRGKKRRIDSDEEDLDELLEAMDGYKKMKRSKKLKNNDLDEDDEATSTYQPGGRGIHRPLTGQTPTTPGHQFKAKKASGDIKKKGTVDPFAYIPLQHSQLNRRKKSKLAGQFKGIVGAARRGAVKGSKLKRKK